MLGLFQCGKQNTSKDSDLRDLYAKIDEEIGMVKEREKEKEGRISLLKGEIEREQNRNLDWMLLRKLISEYESYSSDSALKYVNVALKLNREGENNRRHEIEMLIVKADVASHAGLFDESNRILKTLNPEEMDSLLRENYYATLCGLYQYLSEYNNDSELFKEHERQKAQYSDSVVKYALPSSLNYICYLTPQMMRKGDYVGAEKILKDDLAKATIGSRRYSIIASILASLYQQTGDALQHRRYLALSVISDLKGVVKENMAIRALSTAMFEDGDIERANRYLKQSFADANFFSARMRNAQSSRMLPLIDDAYNAKQKEMSNQLRVYIGVVSLLVAILLVVLIFLRKQNRLAKMSNEREKESNRELSALSIKLKDANDDLARINDELKSSDMIKEQYAVLFMEYCSVSISNLQQFHASISRLVAQNNKTALLKKLDSTDSVDSMLKDFYSRFDDAILSIYPKYVERFNSLLRPETRIELKPGEKLNTELRVFALIKIGVSDSAKIAQFLRCSITTIYTYRSKVKKRALNPDSFETDLLSI